MSSLTSKIYPPLFFFEYTLKLFQFSQLEIQAWESPTAMCSTRERLNATKKTLQYSFVSIVDSNIHNYYLSLHVNFQYFIVKFCSFLNNLLYCLSINPEYYLYLSIHNDSQVKMNMSTFENS